MPSTGVDRIDGNTTSTALKSPCTVVATAAITLSGIQTIDGVLLQSGDGGTMLADRVLVTGQADQTMNGIYMVQTSAWIRSYDFDGARDGVHGTVVFIAAGSTYGRTLWQLTTTDNPINIYNGGSNITFAQIGLLSGLSGTSTTSNTIGTGTKTFTTQMALPFQQGQYILVTDQANANNFMNGQVTSYNNITGVLVLNVTGTGGSGTKTAWNIIISGPTGATGSTGGFVGPEASLASAGICDLGSTGVFEVDVTLGSSTTINSFGGSASPNSPLYFLRFSSGITLTNSSALILPGRQNILTASGDCAMAKIETSSTQMWRVMGYFPAQKNAIPVVTVKRQVFAISGNYIQSTGMLYCDIEAWGAGAGGGGCTDADYSVGGGGGAGGYSKGVFSAQTIGGSQPVTIGSGGSPGANTGGTGATGGTTSVGTLISATGGLGGVGSNTDAYVLGGNGGQGFGGDIQSTGAPGGIGMSYSNTYFFSGIGGSTSLGGGGNSVNTSANGNGGTQNSGAGGSGACGNGTPRVGGPGADGYVVITEYCSQ